MPSNRQTIPRDQRFNEMLDAAEELFLEHGYVGTTMVNIAEKVGVTNSSVYWYLKSKDDALAMVQARALHRAVEVGEQEATTDPLDELIRFLEPMRGTRSLHRYLHERAEHSEAIQEVLEAIHLQLEQKIEAAARFQSPDTVNLELLVAAGLAMLEGTSATMSERHGAELIRYLILLSRNQKPA